MPLMTVTIPTDLEQKLNSVVSQLAELGVTDDIDEIMAFIIEEGLDVVCPTSTIRMNS